MISVIIPAYNEADQIFDNVTQIIAVLKEHKITYEFLLVNDGSTDHTWGEMKRLAQTHPHIAIINLSRNFGKEAALCAGLENAGGDACIIMDSDLQHPPQLIPEMVRLWREEGFDVVEGVKTDRGKETFWARSLALGFYQLFARATGINLDHASDYKLLDRKVVEAWKQLKESDTFFRGILAWLGYKRIQVPFQVQNRLKGNSKWSYKSRLKLAVKSIVSFSSAPLYLTTWLGVLLLMITVVLTAQTLFMKFSGKALSGFTTVILLQLTIGSFIMISLGITGLYISKIYDEVKHRPRYLVAEMQGKSQSQERKYAKLEKYKRNA
jgi:glycosyltransferase involved in cell wall biosynthesis